MKRLGSDAEILIQALQEDELRRAIVSSTSTVSRQVFSFNLPIW